MRCPLLLPLVVLTACQSFAMGAESEPQMAITVYNQDGSPAGIVQGKVVARDGEFSTVRLPDAVKRAEVQAAPQVATQQPAPSAAAAAGDLDADQSLLHRKLAELDQLQAEIDQLLEATGTPRQIVVNIEMLEVSLTKLRKVGVAYQRDPGGMIVASDVAKLRSARGYTGAGAPADVNAPEDGSIAEFISLLKQNNIAKTLANPSLVTMSGKQASFLVGGEFPLPANPGSEATVQFKEFGTRVDLLTKLLGNNRVRLAIRPRISEIDDSRAIEIGGLHVPALRVRECAATCDVQLGETFALGGPSENRIEAIQRGGRVEEVVNEIGFWVVVRADSTTAMDPQSASGR